MLAAYLTLTDPMMEQRMNMQSLEPTVTQATLSTITSTSMA